jgi:hypothetical protein
MKHRLYHLWIRKTSGITKRLTGYPMTHAECCVMKSKFSTSDQARIYFEEANENPTNPQG